MQLVAEIYEDTKRFADDRHFCSDTDIINVSLKMFQEEKDDFRMEMQQANVK